MGSFYKSPDTYAPELRWVYFPSYWTNSVGTLLWPLQNQSGFFSFASRFVTENSQCAASTAALQATDCTSIPVIVDSGQQAALLAACTDAVSFPLLEVSLHQQSPLAAGIGGDDVGDEAYTDQPVSEVFQRTLADKRRKAADKRAVATGSGKEGVSRTNVENDGERIISVGCGNISPKKEAE